MWCVAGLLWVLLGPGAAESGRAGDQSSAAGDQSSAAGDLVQQAASYLRRLARDEAVVAALQVSSNYWQLHQESTRLLGLLLVVVLLVLLSSNKV